MRKRLLLSKGWITQVFFSPGKKFQCNSKYSGKSVEDVYKESDVHFDKVTFPTKSELGWKRGKAFGEDTQYETIAVIQERNNGGLR